MTRSPLRREPPRLGAVILAGGTGARLGGVDKAALRVDGVTLLERALTATSSASEVVVVGPRRHTTRPVTWTRETPAGGGPAAGVLAGLDAFTTVPRLVCVLAVDMPHVTAATVGRLVDAVEASAGADAAMVVDAAGVRQPLAAVYVAAALLSVRPSERGSAHGLPVRRLVASFEVVDVPAVGEEARDLDTWADLAVTDRPSEAGGCEPADAE